MYSKKDIFILIIIAILVIIIIVSYNKKESFNTVSTISNLKKDIFLKTGINPSAKNIFGDNISFYRIDANLYPYKVDEWKTGGTDAFKGISFGPVKFLKAVQIHTGEVLGIGTDGNIYLINTNSLINKNSTFIKIADNKGSSFQSITQLNNYKILVVDNNTNIWINDYPINPNKWEQINRGDNPIMCITQYKYGPLLIGGGSGDNKNYSCTIDYVNKILTNRRNLSKYPGNDTKFYYAQFVNGDIFKVNNNGDLYYQYNWNGDINVSGGQFKATGTETRAWFFIDTQWIKPNNINLNQLNLSDFPIIDGLYAGYNVDSFKKFYDGNLNGKSNIAIWYDIIGNNNVVYLRGDIKISNDNKYIYGDINTSVSFPAILPSQPEEYTLIHLAKYNGSNKKRILQGNFNNWFSGFDNNKSGVAFHGGSKWITEEKDFFSDGWVLSVDQPGVYRANKINLATSEFYGFNERQSALLSINDGFQSNQKSDWAVALVLVFRRKLLDDEINKVEDWIYKKYKDFFLPTYEELGYKVYKVGDKEVLGKINSSFTDFLCPTYDSKTCVEASKLKFPMTNGLKEKLCGNPPFTDEENICKTIFDDYNLYASNNPLIIRGKNSQQQIKNTITDPIKLKEFVKNYSQYMDDPNSPEGIETGLSKVMDKAGLKQGCCFRNQGDNLTRSANILVPISPDLAVKTENVLYKKMDYQKGKLTIPEGACPANLYGGSEDCNAFYDVYCQNAYNLWKGQNFKADNPNTSFIEFAPQCGCYEPAPKDLSKYEAVAPKKCYNTNCQPGLTTYLDPYSRKEQCSYTICENIIKTGNLSDSSVEINPVIQNNCGPQIGEAPKPTELSSQPTIQPTIQPTTQPTIQQQISVQTKDDKETNNTQNSSNIASTNKITNPFENLMCIIL